jgi:hypothetical protein
MTEETPDARPPDSEESGGSSGPPDGGSPSSSAEQPGGPGSWTDAPTSSGAGAWGPPGGPPGRPPAGGGGWGYGGAPPGGPPGSPSAGGGGWGYGGAPPGGPPGGAGGWGATPPPYLPVPSPSERFRAAWQGRVYTDYIFNFWTALGWTVLTLGIYGFYVFYQMVRRMRDHNARRLDLLEAALAFGWEEAERRGLQDDLTPSFQRASLHVATLRKQTTEFRDPIIWLLLSIIASAVIHVIAFILLDQDLVTHDQAEVGIEYELALIYGQLGQQLSFPDQLRVKHPHNYVGRVVATVFSFGIYFLWWYYNMMREGNEHFYKNWTQEDALANAVQALR